MALGSADISRLLGRILLPLRSRASGAFAIYLLSFLIAGLTPFVLLPILTRVLDPAEFGQASSWIIATMMISNIFGLSTHGLISVRYFKVSEAALGRLLGGSLLAVGIAHAIAVAYLLIAPDPLAEFTGLPKPYTIGAAAIAFLLSVNVLGLVLMQVSQRPVFYLALRSVQAAIEIGGCLLLLETMEATPDVRILSYAAAIAGSCILAFAYLVANGSFRRMPDAQSFRDLSKFGLPMIPHVVAGQFLTNLDRVIVSLVLGIEQLGVFMVASQLGMAMSLVIEPLNRALAPVLFKHLADEQEDHRQTIVRYTYVIFIGLLIIAIGISAAFLLVYDYVFSTEFSGAKALVVPIAFGMAFQGMYYGVVNYVFFAEQTARLSMVTVTVVALSAGTSYLLVSSFGLMGGAISFMLTNFVLFVSVWLLANKVLPMPWLTLSWRVS